MAIKLTQKEKGIEASYWRINNFIYNDSSSSIQVILGLYVNEEAKDDLNNFLIREEVKISGVNEIELPNGISGSIKDIIKGLLYMKIKESKIQKIKKVGEDGQPILDGDGKPIIEEVETNKFVNAEDC